MASNEEIVVAKELADRSEAELVSLCQTKVEELHAARFKKALGQLSRTHTLRQLKKDIARIRTVLRQREIAAPRSQEGKQP